MNCINVVEDVEIDLAKRLCLTTDLLASETFCKYEPPFTTLDTGQSANSFSGWWGKASRVLATSLPYRNPQYSLLVLSLITTVMREPDMFPNYYAEKELLCFALVVVYCIVIISELVPTEKQKLWSNVF